jgi:PmbA protein
MMDRARREDLAARLLDAARAAGAENADVVIASGESLSAETRHGRLEHAERAEGIDLGLRVLIGRRQACAAASDARPQTLAALAERAVAMAKAAPDDPWCGLADPGQLAAMDLRDAGALLLDDRAGPPAAAALEADALAAEAACAAVEGVAQVGGAGASWSRTAIFLAASNGFSGGYARSHASIFASAIAGEGLGMESDHAAETRRARADLPSPESIGRLAGQRAVERLTPRRAPTGPAPVLFDQRVSASLIGHLSGAANGASVARGSSWLKDRLGDAVLPAGFDLIEEPLRVHGAGSRPFDGEGIAAQARKMVSDGRLMGWTLDLASARQLGLKTSGNAGRGMSSPPSPSVTNLRLTAPGRDRADMLRSMGTGLLVTSLIGASINANTGDYSRGAAGFWIEDGQIAYPVNELTIAGNLHAMLLALEAGNDADPHRGAIVPSLLVARGLTVAGG